MAGLDPSYPDLDLRNAEALLDRPHDRSPASSTASGRSSVRRAIAAVNILGGPLWRLAYVER